MTTGKTNGNETHEIPSVLLYWFIFIRNDSAEEPPLSDND